MKKRRRDKVLSLRLTENEKKLVDEVFNHYNQSNTDTFMKMMLLQYKLIQKEKRDNDCM